MTAALLATILTVLMVRFGLLPFVMARVSVLLIELSVFSVDSRAPYLAASYVVVGTILAIAAYGFHTALAGRPMFGGGFLKDEPSAQ